MEDFKTRLLTEQTELQAKLEGLTDFLDSDGFNRVSVLQRKLLTIQQSAMHTYLNCLTERVEDIFSKKESGE